ncbi:transketolase [PVC group bacterium]|nr:transketolase [PVC group bacterium]
MGNRKQGTKNTWQEQAKNTARGVRLRVLDHTVKNNGGYLSQACSAAEILSVLYEHVMCLGPSEGAMVPVPFAGVPRQGMPQYQTGALYNGPKNPEYDRFIMSPVHYALVLYALLVEVGRMAEEGLELFNQDGSTVEMIGAEHSPGHEVTAGSLGQALSQAGGIAYARKRKKEKGRVWVFMSDGEFQSGQTWEALQALSFHKLDNIGIYVDVNSQQCDGAMVDVMNVEPLEHRIKFFGARVHRVNGHDVDALSCLKDEKPDGRPQVVLAITNPCQGISLLEKRRPKLHYVRFKDENEQKEYKNYLNQMQNSTDT